MEWFCLHLQVLVGADRRPQCLLLLLLRVQISSKALSLYYAPLRSSLNGFGQTKKAPAPV